MPLRLIRDVLEDYPQLLTDQQLVEFAHRLAVYRGGGTIRFDLRGEQWLLDVPGYALCREDCKGLCPTCGADLNEGECECPPAADSRWDALRKIDSK